VESTPSHIETPRSRFRTLARRIVDFLFENPERDPYFREEMQALARRGLRLCCVLGALMILFYFGMKIRSGRMIDLTQGIEGSVSGWDKFVMLTLIAIGFGASFTRFGTRHARLIVGIIILMAGFATVIDDFTNQNTAFATGWLAVILIVPIGIMPYRALHAFLLGLAMSFIYPIVLTYGPALTGLPEIHIVSSQKLFMWIMAIIATVISGNLYHNRFRAYRHRADLKEAGKHIAEQADRLQELDRIKARFFANLSHEFRTPLTLMLGPVEDALQGQSGPISARLQLQLQMARRNGKRLKQLINQLLDLSRLEAGRMELEAGMYDMITFSRAIVSSFMSLAETRDIALTFHAESEELIMAFDSDKVEKILTNLLSNAIKFTPRHGKVRLSVDVVDGNQALICVKDTGTGISEVQRTHVFDRFYQVGSGESVVQAGTGIGLALVKELTELHDGTISLETDEGFGSTFSLRLPIRLLEDGGSRPTATAILDSDVRDHELSVETLVDDVEETAPEDAPLVLVADDNDDIRAYLRGHLEKHYRVVEARDGNEAIRLLDDELPALVLSDVMMPGKDGHEVCRIIKGDERTNHIPVVLVTARASAESRRQGLEMGADDYLFKPFNATDLMIRVENLIEIRRILRERFSGEYILKPTDVAVKSAEAEFLERLQNVVEERIGDTNFGVEWLASEVGISPRQLQRRLRASLGLSAAGYIRILRLERAAQLLDARNGTVSEIAYKVGFLDANYFSRLFRQTFGMPPSEYAGRSAEESLDTV